VRTRGLVLTEHKFTVQLNLVVWAWAAQRNLRWDSGRS
jgi:hypothetical protein